jgi:carbon-monoxide dehydrogenase small subunit
MTGTKEGCGTGECGACTVLISGRPALACLTLAGAVEGKEILTIEGTAAGGKALHALQRAFLDTGAVQCGFCTPGMIMSSLALLLKNPKPSAEEIREAVSGNTCRCTGYHKIVRAVEKASQQVAEEEK